MDLSARVSWSTSSTTESSGLWAASEFSYDVAILDIMLPGMNGYRVLEEIREREIWTPVIMLTAKDGEYDQTDAFDLGADDYLTKPFSFKVLVARLRALIRRGAPERPATSSPLAHWSWILLGVRSLVAMS